MAPVEELALLDFDRSNKGASKQRRDQINAEIATMRDLLPLPESSRQRLSQLQIMSLTCVYIRKCNVLQKLFRPKSQDQQLPDTLDFFQALTGFLLVTTREGKLLYISENVTDFLGHSMVDMKTQGDSLYDIVDKRDHGTVQAQLLGPQEDKDSLADVSFFCRMNMSRTLKRQSGFGDVKVMHVRGHFIQVHNTETGCSSDSQHVFMATCSPLITPDLKENLVQNNTMVFKTVHQLDMTFLEVTKTAEYHLGCSTEDLSKKSWYSMLHPEDIHEAKEKHIQLIRSNHEMGCMMTVRMLRTDGSSFWVNIVMHVRQASLSQSDEPVIVCINQVIDAREAYQIKVQGHMFSMYPSRAHELWSGHIPTPTAHSQEHTSGHWIQQSGSAPVPVAGYQANIPSYIAQAGRPSMYQPVIKSSAGHPHFNATSLVQSDQLKLMLKRKIQGPQSASCKPVKIAKMSWDMDGSNGGSGYPEMDHHGMPPLEHYGQASLGGSHVECQGQTMQVMQPINYSRIGVMTAKKSHAVLTCQGIPSSVMPKLSSMISEQVVPDVNVPESYLTPDPSPVSSPEPSYVTVKTEVMDPEEKVAPVKSSANILQALEKLASLPQATKQEKVPTVAQPAAMNQMQATAAQKRKELPIFDAFDIDNFFDCLVPIGAQSKTSVKMEEIQIKHEIKTEFPEEQPAPADNIPNFAALKDERATPPQCVGAYQNPCMVPSIKQASPQPLMQPQAQTPAPQTFIPGSPEASALSFPCPDVDARSQSVTSPRRDILVASTMASSPKSTTSQESIDDLLSYFSDDGMDISPLQMDSRSSVHDTSANEDLLDDPYEKTYSKSFYMDSHCSISVPIGTQRLPEELSPQSSTSSLAGEDDVMDDHSTFTLDMALSVLDAQDQREELSQSSIKDRDVLGMPDEFKLDFLLDSLVPSQGSLNVIKNGQ